jgi:hypothetical protein
MELLVSLHHKSQKTLDALFAHPLSMNTAYSDVVHLFGELGAEVEETKKNHLKVKLNGNEMTFIHPHHKNIDDKNQLVAIRDFLQECGITA